MNKNKQRFEHHSKDYSGIREFPVKKDSELLEFLLETLKGQSRNSVKSLLTNHRVSVDGAPISQYNFKLYCVAYVRENITHGYIQLLVRICAGAPCRSGTRSSGSCNLARCGTDVGLPDCRPKR